MPYLYDANEIREREAYTINKVGVPSLVLMERAALSMLPYVKDMSKVSKILIVCGTGNNGADGLALGRLLLERNIPFVICYPGEEERATEENKIQLQILRNLGADFVKDIPFTPFSVIVDALFGIGLNREITGKYKNIIETMNEKAKFDRSPILSADIPSGLQADTGEILGVSVEATATINFGYAKKGCYIQDGPKVSGMLVTKKIGIFSETKTMPKTFYYEDQELKNLLGNRSPYGNKGTFGKVLCICGSDEMGGAALLASKAALKSGAGMVKVISSERNRDIILKSFPEVMFSAPAEDEILKSLDWCNVCILGPGLGQSEESLKLVRFVTKNCRQPLILDADGINLISEDHAEILSRKAKGLITIMTPHPGEYARYFKERIDLKNYKKPEIVKQHALEEGIILVAKDSHTIVSDGDKIYVNVSGNDALATAGSGDVLTGFIASMLCSIKKPFEGAALGVFLHGLSGEEATKLKGSKHAVIASDIITGMEEVLREHLNEE